MIKLRENPIEGTEVKMGGDTYIVPRLNIALFKRYKARLAVLRNATNDDERVEVMLEVITAALKRNYPDITQEEVEDLVEVGDKMLQLVGVVMGTEGLGNMMPAGAAAQFR